MLHASRSARNQSARCQNQRDVVFTPRPGTQTEGSNGALYLRGRNSDAFKELERLRRPSLVMVTRKLTTYTPAMPLMTRILTSTRRLWARPPFASFDGAATYSAIAPC